MTAQSKSDGKQWARSCYLGGGGRGLMMPGQSRVVVAAPRWWCKRLMAERGGVPARGMSGWSERPSGTHTIHRNNPQLCSCPPGQCDSGGEIVQQVKRKKGWVVAAPPPRRRLRGACHCGPRLSIPPTVGRGRRGGTQLGLAADAADGRLPGSKDVQKAAVHGNAEVGNGAAVWASAVSDARCSQSRSSLKHCHCHCRREPIPIYAAPHIPQSSRARLMRLMFVYMM